MKDSQETTEAAGVALSGLLVRIGKGGKGDAPLRGSSGEYVETIPGWPPVAYGHP